MDFSDEPYVRKYTRKTLTSRLLGWEGRAVMDAMLGEFDAAGIFAIRGDAALCVSAVTEIPIEIVRAGLARLVETETWVVTARAITWPTFEEAQNCMRSDRLRQRESRRARAARAVTDVTSGHYRSQRSVTDVTSGHAESPPVTKCHSPSLPSSHPPSQVVASRASARVATPVPEHAPTDATPLHREPVAIKEIPANLELDDELRAEAIAAGCDPAKLDERWRALKGGPIGGRRGVFPHKLRDYVRGQFGRWKVWDETERAQSRAGPPRLSPRSNSDALEYAFQLAKGEA